MPDTVPFRTRHIDIEYEAAGDADLILGSSPDLRGLLVAARGVEQLEARLPHAIRELLEAQGHRVLDVEATVARATHIGPAESPRSSATVRLELP